MVGLQHTYAQAQLSRWLPFCHYHPGLSSYLSSSIIVAENSTVFDSICDLWGSPNLRVPSQRKIPQCKFFTSTSFSILLHTLVNSPVS